MKRCNISFRKFDKYIRDIKVGIEAASYVSDNNDDYGALYDFACELKARAQATIALVGLFMKDDNDLIHDFCLRWNFGKNAPCKSLCTTIGLYRTLTNSPTCGATRECDFSMKGE